MFDTRTVGKNIRRGRMSQNMTQMDLADAMGVSYQAVSNWERGNTTLDISKLEDLCAILNTSLQELLGFETKEVSAVEKALTKDPMTLEEVALVAPILPPKDVEAQVGNSDPGEVTMEALKIMAPYLDDDLLMQLLQNVKIESLSEISEIAPFLSEEALEAIVENTPLSDTAGIRELAVFLSDEALENLIHRFGESLDEKVISDLAVFLSDDALDDLADKQIAAGNLHILGEIACFLPDDALKKLSRACMVRKDMDTLRKIACFL